MTYQFKVGDKGKTRDDRHYRIICDDRKNGSGYSLVVLVEDVSAGSTYESLLCYTSSGRANPSVNSANDLMPPTTTAYWATFHFPVTRSYQTYSRTTKELTDSLITSHVMNDCILVARGTCEIDHEGKRFNFVVTN